MRVQAIFEGAEAVLQLLPETEAEGALLKAFGFERELVGEVKPSFQSDPLAMHARTLRDVRVVMRRKPDAGSSVPFPEQTP